MFAKDEIKPLKNQSKRKWWNFRSKKAEDIISESTTLASFPYSICISSESIAEDPVLGKAFRYMMEKDILDERTSVMAYLAFQKSMGAASPVFPWIQALPQTFDTPLFFSQDELKELRGTVLSAASESVSRRLEDTWGRLAPIVERLSKDLKLEHVPTVEDFKWGYSIFWSRGQSIPVYSESSSTTGGNITNSSHPDLGVVEGIVPGLDFFNHSTKPQCWWEVKRSGNEKYFSPSQVNLVLHPHVDQGAAAGAEVCISYGDKSNEELLMLYGFAVENNPDECVMLHCPIPPSDSLDEMMIAKLELLSAYGLRPQFFLRANNAAKDSIPRDVIEVLEVFVLKHNEIQERIEEAKNFLKENDLNREDVSVIPIRGGRSHLNLGEVLSRLEKGLSAFQVNANADELAEVEYSLGLRMATISTLVRMLEIRVMELEGAEGTGTLEADLALLKKGEKAGSNINSRRRSAIVYRTGQKKLTRELLAATRQELGQILKCVTLARDLSKKRAAATVA
mmetsp:Transcript_21870/g.39020  ORF Transcript_21870/g.39020 Transcript_21870/m.39020 type:complete len:509 (+) Transcript_21870:377-1903(+)